MGSPKEVQKRLGNHQSGGIGPLLILEAPDYSKQKLGYSEAQAVKSILNNLFGIPTSDVIRLGTGWDVFEIVPRLRNHSGIYLSTHANTRGFQVPNGRIIDWATCGKVLSDFPSIQRLFLSGCEAGSPETAAAILKHCEHIRFIFGPCAKPTFGQAALAAHVMFFEMFHNGASPYYAANQASRVVGVKYNCWDGIAVHSLISLLRLIRRPRK